MQPAALHYQPRPYPPNANSAVLGQALAKVRRVARLLVIIIIVVIFIATEDQAQRTQALPVSAG